MKEEVSVSERVVEEKETGRLEAFSDGVFAIAVTLLVLELRVPQLSTEATNSELWSALLSHWPSYAAYLVSFLTILIMWVNHHRLFWIIQRSDSRFLLLTGALLLTVTINPVPTARRADYQERPPAPGACAIYTGTYVLLALAFNALWRYAAYRNRLLARTTTDQQVAAISRSFLFGPVSYTAAFILAFVNVFVSLALCLLLAIFWAVTGFEPAAERAR
jgi:uncharacterized membrane protein